MTIPASSHSPTVDARQILYAFAQTALLIAAVRLRLFTILAESPLNASELKLAHAKDTSLQILDVGAGSAPWSVAFAQCYPSSHITALDLPSVVAQGQQQIAELGLEDRYTWISASIDAVELSSHNYDLIIIAHVLRFMGEQRAKHILQKMVKSLRPRGTLIVADIFLAEDQQGPKSAITLDLSMLVNTKQGHIRTWREIAQWLNACGLEHAQSFHVAGPFPIVFAEKAP